MILLQDELMLTAEIKKVVETDGGKVIEDNLPVGKACTKVKLKK